MPCRVLSLLLYAAAACTVLIAAEVQAQVDAGGGAAPVAIAAPTVNALVVTGVIVDKNIFLDYKCLKCGTKFKEQHLTPAQ